MASKAFILAELLRESKSLAFSCDDGIANGRLKKRALNGIMHCLAVAVYIILYFLYHTHAAHAIISAGFCFFIRMSLLFVPYYEADPTVASTKSNQSSC